MAQRCMLHLLQNAYLYNIIPAPVEWGLDEPANPDPNYVNMMAEIGYLLNNPQEVIQFTMQISCRACGRVCKVDVYSDSRCGCGHHLMSRLGNRQCQCNHCEQERVRVHIGIELELDAQSDTK